MSIYKRHDVNPEWEPIPWDAKGPQVDEQESGFHQRALKPLVWKKVDWKNFPKEGIFGRDRDWFVGHDIQYVTTLDGEDLILVRNSWSGWPDPPEWGLASRPAGSDDAKWERWGHFPDLPAAWLVPGERPDARFTSISFGDNVRVRATVSTQNLGLAGKPGEVRGFTTPSVTKVKVIGDVLRDAAFNVFFEDLGEDFWFAPELLEFVDHAPGTKVTIKGMQKEWVRGAQGEWNESPLPSTSGGWLSRLTGLFRRKARSQDEGNIR